MIKLFVDDLRPAPEGWVLVRTVTEAIRLIDTQEISDISLDHDISMKVSVNGEARPFKSEETFEPVARFLREKITTSYKGRRIRIILHSANQTGRENMERILLEGGEDLEIRHEPRAAVNKYEGTTRED